MVELKQIFKQRLSKKTKLQIAAVAAVVLAAIAYTIWDILAGGPLTSLFSNRELIIERVQSWGIFGPLLYMLLQLVQTVVAPIPAQLVGTIGGYLFGWWGILWTTLGSAIGYFIVFKLSRRFGRPLVEKIFKKSALDKFDFIMNGRATFVLFAIFLIPGLPDDMVCYLAGLTDLPIRKLMVLVLVGRLPAVVVTNMFGAGLGENNMVPVVTAVIIAIVAVVVVYYKRDAIMTFLRDNSGPAAKDHDQHDDD